MDRPGRQAKACQKGRSPTVQNCTSQAKVRDEACLLISGQTDDNDIPPGPLIPFFLRDAATLLMGQGEIGLSKKAYLTESCKTDARGGCGGRKRPNLIAYLTRFFFHSVSTGVEQRKTASG